VKYKIKDGDHFIEIDENFDEEERENYEPLDKKLEDTIELKINEKDLIAKGQFDETYKLQVI